MSKCYYIYLITYLIYIDVSYDVGIALTALRSGRDTTNSRNLSAHTLYIRYQLKTQFT
jgi:hypothetical protein